MFPIWAGFGAVWLGTLAALIGALVVARARAWLRFRAEVRALERELDALVPGWKA